MKMGTYILARRWIHAYYFWRKREREKLRERRRHEFYWDTSRLFDLVKSFLSIGKWLNVQRVCMWPQLNIYRCMQIIHIFSTFVPILSFHPIIFSIPPLPFTPPVCTNCIAKHLNINLFSIEFFCLVLAKKNESEK